MSLVGIIFHGFLDLVLGLFFMFPLGTWKIISKTPLDKSVFNKKPKTDEGILLLHGSGANEMHFLVSRSIIDTIMKKEGKPYRVYSCDLSDTYIHDKTFGIEQFTQKAYQYLSEIIKKDNLYQVTVIGHSMGGLVAGELACMERRIRKVITIGTPWNGAPLLGKWVPAKRYEQMRTGSDYLSDLKHRMILNNNEVICIGSKYDYQVPEQHAFLNIPFSRKISTCYGHTMMIMMPSTWKIIFSFLN